MGGCIVGSSVGFSETALIAATEIVGALALTNAATDKLEQTTTVKPAIASFFIMRKTHPLPLAFPESPWTVSILSVLRPHVKENPPARRSAKPAPKIPISP